MEAHNLLAIEFKTMVKRMLKKLNKNFNNMKKT